MSKTSDDLQAVRVLVETLEPFDPTDRERIIRWAREKLGMAGVAPGDHSFTPTHPMSGGGTPESHPSGGTTPAANIRTFIQQKSPKNDLHLAAVVAHFHHFQAPPDQRKDSIAAEDLVDACRQADRHRPKSPSQTLINTFHAGFLDKAGDRGRYRLNSVGENLVAMVLPESESGRAQGRASRRNRIASAARKKPSPKKKVQRVQSAKRS